MDYFPINLDINGRPCLVIGGGRVAERKVLGLLEYGAEVTVISPELTAMLAELRQKKEITVIARPYKNGDLAQAFLVIAATDDEKAQEEIHAEAEKDNILLNVADVPKWCNFILPATVRRGELSISISTSGNSPALARRLRQGMETQFGPEYEPLLELLGCLRPVVLAQGRPHSENKIIFEKLLHPDLLTWLNEAKWDTIKDHFRAILGPETNFACLTEVERANPAREEVEI